MIISIILLLTLFLLLFLLLLSSSMLSLSILFLMKEGCGGDWRSGKSPVTLRIK